ncbi:metal-dependent hydrolase, partial [Salmonella enterica subsp. enterica serovar Agona]|nr:metal-dependent hydrolase [Salmonella enterica subsp. enterica serovar Agona]
MDTHCHFDFPPFYGRMTRASNSGVPVRRAVEKIIVPATEA